MALNISPLNMQTVLQQDGEKLWKEKGAVLFRRGEKASGMFVVLSGRVRLDCGVDSPFSRSYGLGALVGLPATLTRGNHTMTAIVTEAGELGFWPIKALDLLLQNRPDFCRSLLAILGAEMEASQRVARALLGHEELPVEQPSTW